MVFLLEQTIILVTLTALVSIENGGGGWVACITDQTGENHTLLGDTYLYSLYKRVPPLGLHYNLPRLS